MAQDLSCSAPGSLMLMGEHAVLQGKQALSCAVDKRIKVHLRWRCDDQIIIQSQLGRYCATLSNLTPDPRFAFVLGSLENLPSGLELFIESEFSHQVGLGSSAAVTAATVACLHGPATSTHTLFEKSLSIVRKVQGIASGADVAASVFGGVVLYRMNPVIIESLPHLLPLTLIYSGSKMATRDVISQVLERKNRHTQLFDAIFNTMDRLVTEAKEAIIQQDLPLLGALFNMHHGLQEAIGTCNRPLAEIVHTLRAQPGIYGAKISGSGLGDCAIGLGTADIDSIPVQMSKQGILFL